MIFRSDSRVEGGKGSKRIAISIENHRASSYDGSRWTIRYIIWSHQNGIEQLTEFLWRACTNIKGYTRGRCCNREIVILRYDQVSLSTIQNSAFSRSRFSIFPGLDITAARKSSFIAGIGRRRRGTAFLENAFKNERRGSTLVDQN